MRKTLNFKLQKLGFVARTNFTFFTTLLLLLQTSSSFSQAGLITNITATTGNSYTLGTLATDITYYTDRIYQITSVPSYLNNTDFIKTPNDDKTNTGASVLSFNLTEDATVIVAYDPRATALPSWLGSWQKLSVQIGVNDPKVSSLDLYSKNFQSGNVTLGGNLASPAAGSLLNYFVIATTQSPGTGFTLTVTTNGNGSVTKNPNQSSYSAGTDVTLTASPGTGQQFNGWSGDASGSVNPLTVDMNGNKAITASFGPTSTAAQATVTPLAIYDNDVSGGAAGPNRTVTVKNTGSGVLSLSSINLSGANTSQFSLSGLPAFPKSINSGSSITFSIAFKPSSTGLKTASINISSNDPSNPVISIPARGLGTAGAGGTNEPSLQAILNLLEIQVDAGDDDVATTVINSSSTKQKAALLGDEVSIQSFENATSGPVTITPLAVFGPTNANPVVALGWYESGNTGSKSELFTVSNSPLTNGQTVNVNFTGSLSFNPGSEEFGFYSRWPHFSNRHLYSEDKFNTFTGAIPHHVRVYPYKKNGVLEPNSYVVAFEEHISGFDYQDILIVVSNVKKAGTTLPASNAALYVENVDKIPSHNDFVFSRVQIPWRRKSVEPFNSNNDSVKIRIHNKGTDPLIISNLTLSNTTTWKIEKLNTTPYTGSSLPVSITNGNFLDVFLRFIAKDQATRVKILHETLKITSNDHKNKVKTVFLHGIWQRAGEGNREPYAGEIIDAFAFKTKTGFVHTDPDMGDSTKLKGDEIKPSFFVRANPSLPVTSTQMAAYHGCCYFVEELYWYVKGTTTLTTLYSHGKSDAQRALPRQPNGTQVHGTFNPTTPFAFKIGFTDRTDASKNPGKKIGIRVWKAINGDGEIIPNTYIISNDYLGTTATNYDYNDNLHLISNVKPEVGSVFYSVLTATPSDADFGEKVLQSTNTMQVSLKSLGKSYSNGSSDPVITIKSVQITGENSSEFSADPPLDFTLTPQQTSSISIKFKPVTQGLKIADLLIHHDNSPTPLRVPLYGIAKGANTTVKVHHRIKGGRSSSLVVNGKTWSGDNGIAFDNLEPYTKSGLEIAGTDDDALYTTEQSSNGDKKPFRYQIPVPNGNYVVRLHFAEIFWGIPGAGATSGAGARVFSVKLENQTKLVNLDLIDEVGTATALIKNIPVTVTDQKIDINFLASTNRPMVSAVEVYSFSSGSSRPEEITAIENELALPSAGQAISGHEFGKPHVYPNPLRSPNFTIQFPSRYQGIFNIQLIDILGREYNLGKTRLSGAGSNMKVDVSRFSLKPGLYFLRINSDSGKADLLKLLIN